MVLNDAPSEKNQDTWYARLTQERRELSASVEETLINSPIEESFWLDEQSQYTPVVRTDRENNVFPPRLTLQSRALSGISSRVGSGLVNTHDHVAQHRSIWARLAHRLALLFAPFQLRSSSVAVPPVASNNISTQSAQAEGASCYADGTRNASSNRMSATPTHEVSCKNECRSATGAHARHRVSRGTQGRQRLAGRTTRVRLEVVPAAPLLPDMGDFSNKSGTSVRLPVVEKGARQPLEDDRSFVDGNGGFTSVRLPVVEKVARRPVDSRPTTDNDGGTTSVRLPVVEKVARRPVDSRPAIDSDGGITSVRLPVVEKVARKPKEPAPTLRTGTGIFECGQRDVTVADPSVTASSVVQVMLTANPGPVVVQYISLQPRTGFTIHITAPTTMGAPFNYVVFG